MKVFGLWHGGPNYRPGERRDIETFPSVRAAKAAFRDRAEGRDPSRPCVEDSEMWLWAEMPEDNGDLYPNTILTIGPNGGVREEVA